MALGLNATSDRRPASRKKVASGEWRVASREEKSRSLASLGMTVLLRRGRRQDAVIEEGSLHCAARRAGMRRGREDRAAPVGMTISEISVAHVR